MSVASEISEIREIPLGEIEISSFNVRIENAEVDLEELAKSIELHGLLQPVVLMGEYGSPKYQLISGQRRFLAHERFLKTKTIKAVFVAEMSETDTLIRSLVENMQRTDLEFRDTQKVITKLYKEFGDDKEVSKATGLSLKKVRDHIMVEEQTSKKIQDQIASGQVSIADVKRALQGAKYELAKAEKLIDLIIKFTPTSEQKRRIRDYGKDNSDLSADDILDKAMEPHIEKKLVVTLDDDLRSALGKAVDEKQMELSDLAGSILEDWLREEGFYK